MARRNDSSSRFLPTETIFSYSMYSGSMDCRVCSNNIKGIVMREERMKGNRGRKEEVAETKALCRFLRGRNRPRKGKTIRKRGKIVGTRNIPSRNQNQPTSPDILPRIFPVSSKMMEGGNTVQWRFQGRVAKDIIADIGYSWKAKERRNNSRLQRVIKANPLIFDRDMICIIGFIIY